MRKTIPYQAKYCNICGEMKDLSAFAKQKRNPDNLHYSCKECVKICRKNNLNTRKYQQSWNLKRKFGLTSQDYNRMFEKQKGCCAICGRHQSEFKRALVVDHNHSTDKVRGLLCINCNLGLGHFKDSRGCLVKAVQYLGKSRKV